MALAADGRFAMDLDVDPQTERLLDAFGFDSPLFLELRRRMLAGELSTERNRLHGLIEPPRPRDILSPSSQYSFPS